MNKKQQIREIDKKLEKLGVNSYDINKSGVMTQDEEIEYKSKILGDILASKTNNSTRINKKEEALGENDFYLGFMSDTHSRLYLLEDYLFYLNGIGGKCVVLGDISNGGTLAGDKHHHHEGVRDFAVQPKHDTLALADIYRRYPGMFIGSIEGNHEQWNSDYTGMHIGKEACKLAKVDTKYADNVQIVTQRVTYNGKVVPFNFLVIHGTGMPANVVNALKKSLTKAMSFNVDAIIFGHTHKMGSSSLSVLNKDGHGKWVEKQFTTYNPGTTLETSDYADVAGYPANKPFDGSVMHCRVVEKEDPKTHKKTIKKVIDIENIMDVMSNDDRKTLKALKNKLSFLETRNYESKKEIGDKYSKLFAQYDSKNIKVAKNKGQYFIAISGTSDMYSPNVSKEIRDKIRADLEYVVSVAKEIKNVSIVLNGDLIYDYNQGYIAKQDRCADIIADIQDLTKILQPVANKVVVINNGKMEESLMKVERDKSNGRIGNGKNKIRELANYAIQVLQLDKKLAYAPYDKQEMHNRQIAIRNNQIDKDNQTILDKAYDDFMVKVAKNTRSYEGLEDYFEKSSSKSFNKRIKEALAKKLRKEHKILDISNPEDQEIIDERYPLAAIDLRMPNENLVGNIICKMLGNNLKMVNVNSRLNYPATFKVKDENGKSKIVKAYYCTSVPRFLRELSPKLASSISPADVVLINNSGTDLQEWTTYERINYMDKNGNHKSKDVVVIDSGSFAYSKYLSTGKVPTNMVYKVVDVEPIFQTLIPDHSVNYPGNGEKPIVEKYNYESVLEQNSVSKKIILDAVKQSCKKTLEKFDIKRAKQENVAFVNDLSFNKAE